MRDEKNKPKILIADDDHELVTLITKMFNYEGYEVFAAYEGIRVIEAAHKHKPDLILLDYNMPTGNALSVLKALQSHMDTQKIPILIFSGIREPKIQDQCRELGANGFIQKPFETISFLSHINNLLEMSGTISTFPGPASIDIPYEM